MYELMQTLAVVMMCIMGVATIIVSIADATRHNYGWFATLFGVLAKSIGTIAPIFLWVMGAYPIVLLFWYLISTYTNFNIVITVTP